MAKLSRKSMALLTVLAFSFSCGSEKKKGKVSAAFMKTETVPNSKLKLLEGSSTTGSMVQSFTPTSIKVPIFSVSMCSGESSCHSIYKCSANTVEGCSIELAEIEAFVEALNTGETTFSDGEVFDRIGVQYCPDGDQTAIQHISVKGTVKIQGTEYATDSTLGLIAGSTASSVSLPVQGGCGHYYPTESSITISKDNPIKVSLYFDATLYAYAGVAGGTVGTNDSYNDQGGCAGNKSAYVCAPLVSIVPTVGTDKPVTEHYLVANTESSASNSPTAAIALYYTASGKPLGGIQNPYRVSGADVTWGQTLGGGLNLDIKTVDTETVSFGEPEGSVQLVDWFKAFKRASHSGTYTYSASQNVTKEGTYQATKL